MRKLALISFCLALSACATVPPLMPTPDTPALPEVAIHRFPEGIEQYFRYSSGMTEPANLVITQRGEWDGLWAQLVARHGSPPAAPAVDLSREMLLVAAMGTQSSGGYAIHIDRVLESDDTLEVFITRTSPGPRCGATAALTNPLDIARVPVSMKPVRWSMRDAESVCP